MASAADGDFGPKWATSPKPGGRLAGLHTKKFDADLDARSPLRPEYRHVPRFEPGSEAAKVRGRDPGSTRGFIAVQGLKTGL